MTRMQVLFNIDTLLTGCHECPTRKQMVREYGSRYAVQDSHCNKNCQIGKKLQELGRKL